MIEFGVNDVSKLSVYCVMLNWLMLIWQVQVSFADPDSAEAQYRETIKPVLETYCFDCHANGSAEGDLAFDRATVSNLVGDLDLWWRVLKNVRADIMPPVGNDSPTPAERERLLHWIKTQVFGIDPENPDPGRVTVSRLNRTEYRNTIHDLMGIDFNAEVVFPPDDTGFGFDNVGDALTVSPLLMEKYLQSASTIVKAAVPVECKVIPTLELTGKDFQSADSDRNGSHLSYADAAVVSKTIQIEHAGRYDLRLEVRLNGSFDFDPSQCRVTFSADGEELYQAEYKWDERKSIHYQFERNWQPGEHELKFQLEPLPSSDPSKPDEDEGDTYVIFHILHVDVQGPMDKDIRVHPRNYEKFFTRDEPPAEPDQQRNYASEVLGTFTKKAYRGPVDEQTLEKLVRIAEATYATPGKTFEEGIAQAMTAILASPRFLFRFESPAKKSDETFPFIDEYGLASRLSYLFWSTMPDTELMQLADEGKLREQLDEQVRRMLADERSDDFVQNFVGQWLRSRDVEHVSLDPLVALGYGEEYQQLRNVFRRRFRPDDEDVPVNEEEWQRVRERFGELRQIRDMFDSETRRAMRRETDMLFEYIVRNDRSLLDLIDCNYTFLNEKLANLYDISNVRGGEMRRVTLPEGHPRGGVLTQGTMLTVTSNPTRTSPVKRGLFILENILGTPTPPAPPNVPELEDAQKKFGDRDPALREVLALHRESALCSSCHSRMDPLGLALENFNALGMWRETEHGEKIDASGELITGEAFSDIRELKLILTTSRRMDFYRCMTQKLLTYALGRGLDYNDEYTVDEIVKRLDASGGRFSVLISEIVNSAQFQRTRRPD